MNKQGFRMLRLVSVLLLLPGLIGLIVSAAFSTYYLQQLPHIPKPAQQRWIPRNIHGTVVYETEREDRRLEDLEGVSSVLLCLGLGTGLFYVYKWGLAAAINAEAEGVYARAEPE